MNNYLAIYPPSWRDKEFQDAYSDKSRHLFAILARKRVVCLKMNRIYEPMLIKKPTARTKTCQ